MKLLFENWRVFLTEGRKIKYYRAQPALTNIIRTGDYVTMSRRFAAEHASTSAVYRDEDFHVVFALIDESNIKEADNPGEYLYTGEPLKAVPVMMATPDGNVKSVKINLGDLR